MMAPGVFLATILYTGDGRLGRPRGIAPTEIFDTADGFNKIQEFL
jgi:hypothetical protein